MLKSVISVGLKSLILMAIDTFKYIWENFLTTVALKKNKNQKKNYSQH